MNFFENNLWPNVPNEKINIKQSYIDIVFGLEYDIATLNVRIRLRLSADCDKSACF
jgi:hypothetical protein